MNDKKISWVLIGIGMLFLILIIYLTAVDFIYREEYTSSNLNARTVSREESVVRGTIYDRNGEILAQSENADGTQKRVYPYGAMYSHVIGYSSKTYGKSFLEKTYNNYLLGGDNLNAISNIKNLIAGEMSEGNNVYLTIDHKTQAVASNMMDKYRGALVALDPQTGEILAMVSKPDFNPDEEYLDENWENLNENEHSPFLNRATMGLYPPGSTFKTVTAAMLYEKGMSADVINDSEGRVKLGGHYISNAKGTVYGETDIEKAFIKSSNVYFATMGTRLDTEDFTKTAQGLLFNKKPGVDFPYAQSKFSTSRMGDAEKGMTAIGQGKTLVSPMHLAMITGAIANGGKMMRPYIMQSVKTPGGTVIKSTSQASHGNGISVEAADFVADLMLETAKSGTGTNAQIKGIAVGGKTGTAENEKTLEDPDKTHALFVAFAPYENPKIAVAVILEYAGSTGGSIAAPIAREVIRTYLTE